MHQQADKQVEKTDLLEPVSVLLIAVTQKAHLSCLGQEVGYPLIRFHPLS